MKSSKTKSKRYNEKNVCNYCLCSAIIIIFEIVDVSRIPGTFSREKKKTKTKQKAGGSIEICLKETCPILQRPHLFSITNAVHCACHERKDMAWLLKSQKKEEKQSESIINRLVSLSQNLWRIC